MTALLSMTPPIIEITALPYPTRWTEKHIEVIGVFTPGMDMNIRSCAAATDECWTGETAYSGERYQFYMMITVYATNDVWLCLDALPDNEGGLTSQCGRAVAYILGGKKYGAIEIVTPAGG